jgi:hypothetical protein
VEEQEEKNEEMEFVSRVHQIFYQKILFGVKPMKSGQHHRCMSAKLMQVKFKRKRRT